MDNDRYEKAVKYVKELKNFYLHLSIYLFVNLGLICINLFFSSENKWFIYPLLGWGVGILVHGFYVLYKGMFRSEDWEKKQIDKYLKK